MLHTDLGLEEDFLAGSAPRHANTSGSSPGFWGQPLRRRPKLAALLAVAAATVLASAAFGGGVAFAGRRGGGAPRRQGQAPSQRDGDARNIHLHDHLDSNDNIDNIDNIDSIDDNDNNDSINNIDDIDDIDDIDNVDINNINNIAAHVNNIANSNAGNRSKRRRRRSSKQNSTLVYLDLGGEQIIRVQRSLLQQLRSPGLSRWASARAPEGTTASPIYVDYSPEVVLPLINYLRLHRDSPPDQRKFLPWPAVPLGYDLQWQAMVHWLGLQAVFPDQVFWGVRTNVNVSELRTWVLVKYHNSCGVFPGIGYCKTWPKGSVLMGFRPQGQDLFAWAVMGSVPVLASALAAGDTDTVTPPIFHNGVFWWRGGLESSDHRNLIKCTESQDLSNDPHQEWMSGMSSPIPLPGHLVIMHRESPVA